MKIIFLASSLNKNSMLDNSTIKLIEELILQKNKVGIWSESKKKSTNLVSLAIEQINTLNNVFDWDIIVAQDTTLINNLVQMFDNNNNVPIVFWVNNHVSEIEGINLFHVNKFIKSSESIDLIEWGICNELIESIHKPVLTRKKNDNIDRNIKGSVKLLSIAKEGTQSLNVLRMIINAINVNPELQLTIFENNACFQLLKDISNTNILFTNGDPNIEKYITNADIIIGEGSIIYEAMNYFKPVIIAGKRGFGGFVTPENYYDFQKVDFSGRIGGTVGEIIPPEMLLYEIESIIKNRSIGKILEKNYDLVKKEHDVKIIANKLKLLFKEIMELNKNIKQDDSIIKLKPKIAGNIKFYKIDNYEYQIICEPNKTVVGNIDYEMHSILSEFNGNISIDSIFEKHNYNIENDKYILCDSFRQLWTKKIIVF